MHLILVIVVVAAVSLGGVWSWTLVGRVDNWSLRRQGRPQHSVQSLANPLRRVPPSKPDR